MKAVIGVLLRVLTGISVSLVPLCATNFDLCNHQASQNKDDAVSLMCKLNWLLGRKSWFGKLSRIANPASPRHDVLYRQLEETVAELKNLAEYSTLRYKTVVDALLRCDKNIAHYLTAYSVRNQPRRSIYRLC